MDKARVGIADYEEQKARLLAIARGEYRPKKGEPRIWFTSIESFSQVLSSKNQELLNLIIEARPKSINELAALSGRKQGNLSRTLKTLERYGLVRLKRQGRVIAPQALYDRFELDFAVTPPTF
ncbi:MAG TPA: transcriptional regulator [Rhodospirillales bacterium]|nr:transcriptional regulator [Rhodospirillales bacterium]